MSMECCGRRFNIGASRKVLGVLCLLGVVFIWVVSGELIKFIFTSQDFWAPFFLTYFNTALFTSYLLGFLFRPQWWGERGPPRWMCWMKLCQRKNINEADDDDDGDEEELDQDSTTSLIQSRSSLDGRSLSRERKKVKTDESEDDEFVVDGSDTDDVEEGEVEMMSNWRVFLIALGFCPLWFGANYTYNLSLTMTSVASATILSSTSSLFTLCFGFIVKVEKGSISKLLGIFLTLGGVILVSFVDTHNLERSSSCPFKSSPICTLAGDMIAVLGAILYAVYAIYLKVKIKSETTVHMPMFFGFVGLINIVLLWPFLLILNYSHFEIFQLPSRETVLFLFINGFIGTVISDYLWMLCVLLASPLIATVGLSLTIPLSMIADAVIHSGQFSAWYIVGALLAILGFVLVNTTVPLDWIRSGFAKLKQCIGR